MAAHSLRWNYTSTIDENRGGVIVYDGTPSKFFEWKFRTELWWHSAEEDDRPKMVSKIVNSLRGEASLLAMDMGRDKLTSSTGITGLIDAIQLHIFPQQRTEAK